MPAEEHQAPSNPKHSTRVNNKNIYQDNVGQYSTKNREEQAHNVDC